MKNSRKAHEFSAAIKQALERRVASVCSKPGCGRITTGPHTTPEKALSVGNAAHISSAAENGPRWDAVLTSQERSAIQNGVWLCSSCHIIVDQDDAPFQSAELRKWKHEAESRARDALELGRKRDHMPRIVSLLHRSMELIPRGSLARSLPRLFQHVANEEVLADACGQVAPEGPRDPKVLRGIQERARDEVWQLLDQHTGADLAYYGIAHVPLAIHMGYLLGSRVPVHFAERDRDGAAWHWISEGNEAYPPVEVRGDLGKCAGEKDVAVSVSVSYPVARAQIEASVGPMPVIDLGVSAPQLDLVRTTGQVEAYSKAFRTLIETLSRDPSLERVHLFAATPMTISFALGRQIRPTVHPDVIAYNYTRTAARPYAWGLRLRDLSLVPEIAKSF